MEQSEIFQGGKVIDFVMIDIESDERIQNTDRL